MSKRRNCVTIKKTLVLNESNSRGGLVKVKLKPRKKKVSKDPVVYAGKVKYKCQNIDVIEAHFSSTDNNVNVQIQFKIPARKNIWFTGPAISATGKDLAYIEQSLSKSCASEKNNLLTFTYTMPPVGTSILEDIYFETSIGLVDPESEVERDPH
ncbi:hypothetical protein GCM10008090_01360 [Arenicella chitinivorans]|uniref:Uncharacterized protein n=1 Tax=Arenicella chitinivorans TaxID=1329800 RepID=A0A918REH6_9GAMM|nr:hypothetical protein [Arenicella chitinivorans]GGZ96846.1 hypothetical protein GCM10008090_01360 [Arenicella chitinivorans]